MVRHATRDDIPFIVALARKYHAISPWVALGFDAEGLAATLTGIIEGDGVIFVHEHGVICGACIPLYFNPEKKLLCKLFWIAEKSGIELLEAFEAWGRKHADAIIAGSLNDMNGDAVTRLFRQRKYKTLEQQMIRVF